MSKSNRQASHAGARGLRTRDFNRLYRRGARRLRSQHFLVVGAPNRLQATRWGISVKARLGKAVVRNRIKRRLREILRRAALPPGWDFVVQPLAASVASADFARLSAELTALLDRALRADAKT